MNFAPILTTMALAYLALGIGFAGATRTLRGGILCVIAWPVLLFVALRRAAHSVRPWPPSRNN